MEALMIVVGIVTALVLFEAAAWFLGSDSRDGLGRSGTGPEMGPRHPPTWF
jgi:hypothetical protein